jgi:hypothetical protein
VPQAVESRKSLGDFYVRTDAVGTVRLSYSKLAVAYYCFSAAYSLVVPRSLSVIAMVMVLPSGATVMR